MLFLIDYENVSKAGMRGSSYLESGDHIIIFYSEARKHAERRILEDISSSGCVFEVCKLCKTGKNALDFYIASRLGELIGGGYDGVSVIVSNDSGFQAVRDYWTKKSVHKNRVYLSSCIEDGIVSGNEDNERTRELKHLRENLAIGNFHAAYTEKMRMKKVLEELFAGTQYENMTAEIQNLIEGRNKTPKVIYLSSLKLFGRKNGLEIYNKIKECDAL